MKQGCDHPTLISSVYSADNAQVQRRWKCNLEYEVMAFGRVLNLVFIFWILTCTLTLFPIIHTKLGYSRSGVSWEDNIAEYCFQFPMALIKWRNPWAQIHLLLLYKFTTCGKGRETRSPCSCTVADRCYPGHAVVGWPPRSSPDRIKCFVCLSFCVRNSTAAIKFF